MSRHDFSGKVVVVTGGTRGIGRQICESFAEYGAIVETVSRGECDTTFRSGRITPTILDVCDTEASQAYLARIHADHGRIDVLVNNAGGSPLVASENASPRFTRKIIELNLVAPLVLCQQAYPYLVKQSGASIINISSVANIRSSPGTSAYGAAKAGIVNAGGSLAQEWGPAIRVNAIVAGLVSTDLTGEHYGNAEEKRAIAESIGMKRFAKPLDIANACLYLASEEASYVSGAALEVHGGGEIVLSVQQ